MARRGDPRREQMWRELIAAWGESGEAVREFCRQRRIAEPRFYAWRRTLQEQQQPQGQPAPMLVPVRVVANGTLEVVLPTGLIVRVPAGADADAAAQLVAALRAAAC